MIGTDDVRVRFGVCFCIKFDIFEHQRFEGRTGHAVSRSIDKRNWPKGNSSEAWCSEAGRCFYSIAPGY